MTNENLIQRLTKLLPNGGNSVVGITFSEKALALIQSFRESVVDECKDCLDGNVHITNLSDRTYNEIMQGLDQLKNETLN